MSEFDVNGYNSHECDIHNHGYYLGAQSQQAKIDAITKQRDSFIKAHHIAMNDVCEHKAKIDELQKQVITQGQNFNDQAQKLKDTEYFNQKLQARIDSLTIINESLVAYKNQLLDEIEEKGNKDEN